MDLNYLKIGGMWLLKAAILVSLSLVVIFLSSPKAEAATTLGGRLIPNYGVPSIKVDESIIAVENPAVRGQIQQYIGFTVRFTCNQLINGVASGISSIVLTEGDLLTVWQDDSVMSFDAIGGPGEGNAVTPSSDRLEGWLIVRSGQPFVDISTPQLSGPYSEIQLLGLSTRLSGELLRMKGINPIRIVAEGKFDVITMQAINLWADGILLMRDGRDY
jgi:hypothetical protein